MPFLYKYSGIPFFFLQANLPQRFGPIKTAPRPKSYLQPTIDKNTVLTDVASVELIGWICTSFPLQFLAKWFFFCFDYL